MMTRAVKTVVSQAIFPTDEKYLRLFAFHTLPAVYRFGKGGKQNTLLTSLVDTGPKPAVVTSGYFRKEQIASPTVTKG